MLAIGGWLGISYNNERINQLAAILFGAGGGLIGDEVGLLLTFENYWTGITYTFVIAFLTFASILIILSRYSKAIREEFAGFLTRHMSLYFGAFLLIISLAFMIDTNNTTIIAFSSISILVGCLIILGYFVMKIRKGHKKEQT